MLSLGWVMFWKALVVAAGSSVYGLWEAYKARRKAAGLPLRFDARRGVYVVDDRLERYERRARIAFWIAFGAFNVFAAVAVALFLLV